VLDDPTRVADRLAVDHQHGHPSLISQRLDLVAIGAALRHDHLLERDALALERARHLPARAQPVRRRAAAIQRGHR
jgi:hypothetical protein